MPYKFQKKKRKYINVLMNDQYFKVNNGIISHKNKHYRFHMLLNGTVIKRNMRSRF